MRGVRGRRPASLPVTMSTYGTASTAPPKNSGTPMYARAVCPSSLIDDPSPPRCVAKNRHSVPAATAMTPIVGSRRLTTRADTCPRRACRRLVRPAARAGTHAAMSAASVETTTRPTIQLNRMSVGASRVVTCRQAIFAATTPSAVPRTALTSAVSAPRIIALARTMRRRTARVPPFAATSPRLRR